MLSFVVFEFGYFAEGMYGWMYVWFNPLALIETATRDHCSALRGGSPRRSKDFPSHCFKSSSFSRISS